MPPVNTGGGICHPTLHLTHKSERGPGFDTQSGLILSFLLPLIQEGAVVSYWRKYVHKVLVNCLGGLSLLRKSEVRLIDRPNMICLGGLSLLRKSEVRLIDRPNMISDAYCGSKTTQHNTTTLLGTHCGWYSNFKKGVLRTQVKLLKFYM